MTIENQILPTLIPGPDPVSIPTDPPLIIDPIQPSIVGGHSYLTKKAEQYSSIKAPMAKAYADGNYYIYTPAGSGASSGGYAQYAFNITTEGIYKVVGKTMGFSSSNDSFLAQFGNGPLEIWDIDYSKNWIWSNISNRGAGTPTNPQTPIKRMYLTPGTIYIKIFHRDDLCRLSELVMTNDMNYMPGPSQPTPTTTPQPTPTQTPTPSPSYCSDAISNYRPLITKYDVDKDGYISKEELVEALKDYYANKISQNEYFILSNFRDNNCKISYTSTPTPSPAPNCTDIYNSYKANVPHLEELLNRYDINNNRLIEKTEAVNAVNDRMDNKLTTVEYYAIAAYYQSQCQIPYYSGPTKTPTPSPTCPTPNAAFTYTVTQSASARTINFNGSQSSGGSGHSITEYRWYVDNVYRGPGVNRSVIVDFNQHSIHLKVINDCGKVDYQYKTLPSTTQPTPTKTPTPYPTATPTPSPINCTDLYNIHKANIPHLDELLNRYDINNNRYIEKSEVVTAINDRFDNKITVTEYYAIVGYYNTQCQIPYYSGPTKTPTPTPHNTGKIACSCNVTATVTLDGSNPQSTPYTYQNVNVGSHDIKFSKSGYYDRTYKPYVNVGATSTVYSSLAKISTPTPTPSPTQTPTPTPPSGKYDSYEKWLVSKGGPSGIKNNWPAYLEAGPAYMKLKDLGFTFTWSNYLNTGKLYLGF